MILSISTNINLAMNNMTYLECLSLRLLQIFHLLIQVVFQIYYFLNKIPSLGFLANQQKFALNIYFSNNLILDINLKIFFKMTI